jgi:hypothetical protein
MSIERHPMLSDQDLELPLSGWNDIERSGRTRRWRNDVDDQLSLDFFGVAPDLPAPPSNLEPVRALYRQQLGEAGGIVQVDSIVVGSVLAILAIFKFRQNPTGMTYLGSITIPFRDCSFVVKWQCPERGVTGMRDAAVFELVDPPLDETTHLPVGWFADPYDPSYRATVVRNRADDVEWDARFPHHPLSRLRSYLRTANALRLSSRAAHEPPF